MTHNITQHVLWVELTVICNTSSDRELELGRSGSTRLSQNINAWSWEGLGAQGCLKKLMILFQCNLLHTHTSDIGDATNIVKRLEDAV